MWIVVLVLATLLLLLSLTLTSVVLIGQTLCASRNTAELELPTGAAPQPLGRATRKTPGLPGPLPTDPSRRNIMLGQSLS